MRQKESETRVKPNDPLTTVNAALLQSFSCFSYVFLRPSSSFKKIIYLPGDVFHREMTKYGDKTSEDVGFMLNLVMYEGQRSVACLINLPSLCPRYATVQQQPKVKPVPFLFSSPPQFLDHHRQRNRRVSLKMNGVTIRRTARFKSNAVLFHPATRGQLKRFGFPLEKRD